MLSMAIVVRLVPSWLVGSRDAGSATEPMQDLSRRLTNGFSKKVENHAAMISVHFFHYNFCRSHMSLKGATPCMAAGVTSHKWSIQEMIDLLPPVLMFKAGPK